MPFVSGAPLSQSHLLAQLKWLKGLNWYQTLCALPAKRKHRKGNHNETVFNTATACATPD